MSNTNVGNLSIGLDLEFSSNLKSQITGAADKIASSFKSSIESSMGNTKDIAKKAMGDASKQIVEDMNKTGKKSGKILADSLNKEISKVKISPPKLNKLSSKDFIGAVVGKDFEKDARDAATKIDEILDKSMASKSANIHKEYMKMFPDGAQLADDAVKSTKKYEPNRMDTANLPDDALGLASERDNIALSLAGKNKQLKELTAKMTEFVRLGETATPEFGGLEVKYASLDQSIEKLNAKLRELDKQILNFDSSKASRETENLSKKSREATKAAQDEAKSISQKAIQQEREAQAKIRTAIAQERLNQAKKKAKKDSDNSSAGGNSNRKGGMDDDSETEKSSKGLINMKSFAKSMARNLLGLNLILSLTAKGVRALAKAVWSAMGTNEEFKGSLQQIKSNLATAFQPIFNAVMPAINSLMQIISKATAYLAAFISMLFGSTVQASNASAKAMESAANGVKAYSEAVEEAQQITAGFDQLNDITESKGGGGGGGGGTESAIVPVNVDEADIGIIEKALNKIKDVIDKVFNSAPVQAFVSMAKTLVTELHASFTRIFGAIGENIKSTFEAMAPHLQGSLVNISELFTMVFTDIESFISTWFPKITDQIVAFIDNIFDTFEPGLVLVAKIWEDFTKIIRDLWEKYGKRILDAIGQFITDAMETFNLIWTEIIDPIITPAIEWMERMWDEHLKEIVESIGDFIGDAIASSLEFYNEFIKPLVDWLVVTLAPIFKSIFGDIGTTVGNTLENIFITVKDIIGSIRTIFGGFMTFLEGIFTQDWSKIWEGVSTIFEGVMGGLGAIFKEPINFILKGVNFFTKQLNKIKIPSWVPGIGGFGFDLPQFNMLASGGVLKEPTPALMGEYPGARVNPEIVTPESLMREVVNDAIAQNGGNNGGSMPEVLQLNISIGNIKFMEVFIQIAKEWKRQTGQELVINV